MNLCCPAVVRHRFPALGSLALALVAACCAVPVAAADPAPPGPVYWLEADVSMRTIAVNVTFSGARLVIFGSVNRTGAAPADPRPLDIVAVVQGARSRLTVRRKTRVWGLWINTGTVEFEQAPRYYAVASSRPLKEIASEPVLAFNGIGFSDVPMTGVADEMAVQKAPALEDFRAAAIALGVRHHQYVRSEHAISFSGSSLFRGEIDLPANVPVGELGVNVYLFRGGELLARHDSHLTLERSGIENFIYTFAHQHSWAYGLATVALATGVGFLSSLIVSQRSR